MIPLRVRNYITSAQLVVTTGLVRSPGIYVIAARCLSQKQIHIGWRIVVETHARRTAVARTLAQSFATPDLARHVLLLGCLVAAIVAPRSARGQGAASQLDGHAELHAIGLSVAAGIHAR